VGDSTAFAHTSPVHVLRGDRPFTSAADARFLADAVAAVWARLEKSATWRSPADRDRFRATLDKAREVYLGIAQRSSN
jgi:hypothetical protein